VVPTVTQHLLAMQDTMLRFVLPAISAEDSFAREQAGLIMASLGWLADVNESQYLMEAQENDDLVALANGLLELQFVEDDVRVRLEQLVQSVPGTESPLSDLRARNRELKSLTASALDGISTADEPRAVALFSTSGQRLVAREQAYGRMTGLVRYPDGALHEVLAAQRRTGAGAP
jgi:hypothetical protein